MVYDYRSLVYGLESPAPASASAPAPAPAPVNRQSRTKQQLLERVKRLHLEPHPHFATILPALAEHYRQCTESKRENGETLNDFFSCGCLFDQSVSAYQDAIRHALKEMGHARSVIIKTTPFSHLQSIILNSFSSDLVPFTRDIVNFRGLQMENAAEFDLFPIFYSTKPASVRSHGRVGLLGMRGGYSNPRILYGLSAEEASIREGITFQWYGEEAVNIVPGAVNIVKGIELPESESNVQAAAAVTVRRCPLPIESSHPYFSSLLRFCADRNGAYGQTRNLEDESSRLNVIFEVSPQRRDEQSDSGECYLSDSIGEACCRATKPSMT